MHILKTSEKLLIWMHRKNISQVQLAKELNTNRQSIARKIKDNIFSANDLMNLKRIGFNE